jgi:hypothetical protein
VKRFYYSGKIREFILESNESLMGKLVYRHEFRLEEQQRNSWRKQITFLKEWLRGVNGHILFEYSIPRMGKRIDCVVISGSGIFVIEFKVGEKNFKKSHKNQLLDYALDLKYFHQESHNLSIIPILICTKAEDCEVTYDFFEDGLATPLFSSGKNLSTLIWLYNEKYPKAAIDADTWINSEYQPTPTIIEAAQA